MGTLPAQTMFRIYNLSLLRQHTVQHYFFLFYGIIKHYYLAIQPYLQRNLLFANNGVILNSAHHQPPPYKQVQPGGDSLRIMWPSCGLRLVSPVLRGNLYLHLSYVIKTNKVTAMW
jgi:hypothetical protein